MESLIGKVVEAINVANVPAGMRGVVEYNDLVGKLYVLWDNGSQSVIQERGETYRIIEVRNKPKKLFWKLKRLIVFLFRN